MQNDRLLHQDSNYFNKGYLKRKVFHKLLTSDRNKKQILLYLDIDGVFAYTNDSGYAGWRNRVTKNSLSVWKKEGWESIPEFDPISLCNLRSLIDRNNSRCDFYICWISSRRRLNKNKRTLFLNESVSKLMSLCIPGIKHMVLGRTMRSNINRLHEIKEFHSIVSEYLDYSFILDDDEVSSDYEDLMNLTLIDIPNDKRSKSLGFRYESMLKIETILNNL